MQHRTQTTHNSGQGDQGPVLRSNWLAFVHVQLPLACTNCSNGTGQGSPYLLRHAGPRVEHPDNGAHLLGGADSSQACSIATFGAVWAAIVPNWLHWKHMRGGQAKGICTLASELVGLVRLVTACPAWAA